MRCWLIGLTIAALTFSGCWLGYSREDYLPIVDISLSSKQGHYLVRYDNDKPFAARKGEHLVALRVERAEDMSCVLANIVIAGKILFEDGKLVSFDKEFKEIWLTTTPFDFAIQRCEMPGDEKSRRISSVEFHVDGDVKKFLSQVKIAKLIF